VFLPTGGPTNIPTEFTEFGTVAERLGYHTTILAYRNEAPTATLPPAGCGPDAAPPLTPPDCAVNIRKDTLDGKQRVADREHQPGEQHRESPQQAARLPQEQPPREGWEKFVDPNGETHSPCGRIP